MNNAINGGVSVLQSTMQSSGPNTKSASSKSLLKAKNKSPKVRDSRPDAIAEVSLNSTVEPVGSLPSKSNVPSARLRMPVGRLDSPTFKIEDSSPEEQRNYSPFSPTLVTNFSESPYRVSPARRIDSLSPARDWSDEELHLRSPSSPLLTAMREAVDSISQYEDFEILEKIGAGFFAEVFKVRHIPTDEIMVLKINKRMNGTKKMKEVELLKRLSHPNILHYVGACIHEGQLHPLTEYVNGGNLEMFIQNRNQDLPWCLRLQLALDIAQGMEYLHNNGMLHRDLNSKNCLLRKQGSKYTAVVADFGLAAQAPHMLRSMTRTQSVVGNPYWMAPEVLNGKHYNEKVDVFSYGIILCELISRLEADPDEIPRSRDFGLDHAKFKALPDVINSKCPEEFMDLALMCCKVLPVERPDFREIKARLSLIIDMYKQQTADCTDSFVLQPRPSKRLSSHEAYRVHHTPSSGPRETTV